MNYQKIRRLAKGWSSYVWLVLLTNGKKVVLKEVREKSPRKNLAEREGNFLKIANSVGVGPKLIETNLRKNYILMEYIEGDCFRDWIFEEKNISKKQLYFFIKELYKQLLLLDSVQLSHNQLQVGKNILVKTKILSGKKVFFPIIIDFEKSTLKQKTKNIGQIESFLFYNPNSAIAKKIRKILQLKIESLPNPKF
jgi:putative serine/threonine protein kinase